MEIIQHLLLSQYCTIEYQGNTLDFGKEEWNKINYCEEMNKVFGFDFLNIEEPNKFQVLFVDCSPRLMHCGV